MTALESQLDGDPLFADRFALTSWDRRLEARVLAGLESSRDKAEGAGSSSHSIPIRKPLAGESSGAEEDAGLYGHAREVAEFLVKQFGADSRRQRRFVAELAAEVAQRVAEELPPVQAPAARSGIVGFVIRIKSQHVPSPGPTPAGQLG
jgi:hypothetical protein